MNFHAVTSAAALRTSTSLPPDSDAATKAPGFERAPGMRAQLKTSFEKFKAKLSSGRMQSLSSSSLLRDSTANVRSSMHTAAQRASRHSSPAKMQAETGEVGNQTSRHIEEANALLLTTPTFARQSKLTKVRVEQAFQACSNGHFTAAISPEVLTVLKACIQEILSQSPDSNRSPKKSVGANSRQHAPTQTANSPRKLATGSAPKTSISQSTIAFLTGALIRCEQEIKALNDKARASGNSVPQKPPPTTEVGALDKGLDELDKELDGLDMMRSESQRQSLNKDFDELDKELDGLDMMRSGSQRQTLNRSETSIATSDQQELTNDQEREFDAFMNDWQQQWSAANAAPQPQVALTPPPPQDAPPPLPSRTVLTPPPPQDAPPPLPSRTVLTPPPPQDAPPPLPRTN
jgi:hypothetical protein